MLDGVQDKADLWRHQPYLSLHRWDFNKKYPLPVVALSFPWTSLLALFTWREVSLKDGDWVILLTIDLEAPTSAHIVIWFSRCAGFSIEMNPEVFLSMGPIAAAAAPCSLRMSGCSRQVALAVFGRLDSWTYIAATKIRSWRIGCSFGMPRR